MRILRSLGICFILNFSFGQSSWNYYELSKSLKLKTPVRMEKRMVRDLEIHQIEGGNYDWKIIAMPLSSFLKDKNSANFLGQAKNISNTINQDPYTTQIKDSLFLLKGHPVYWTYSKTINAPDQSQNFRSFRFYLQEDGMVYISNFKYYRESKIKFEQFRNFFEELKISKSKESDSLGIKGEETFFYVDDKEAFLKEVYCKYPRLEKSKSYHKIISLNISLELTETGKVEKVKLDPSKMILITRESEAKMQEFFQRFTFKKADKSRSSRLSKLEFVLFLDEKSKSTLCK